MNRFMRPSGSPANHANVIETGGMLEHRLSGPQVDSFCQNQTASRVLEPLPKSPRSDFLRNERTAAEMIFCIQFGARFAPTKAERQVGETGAHPSTLGRRKYPPQAIENSKIMGVSV